MCCISNAFASSSALLSRTTAPDSFAGGRCFGGGGSDDGFQEASCFAAAIAADSRCFASLSARVSTAAARPVEGGAMDRNKRCVAIATCAGGEQRCNGFRTGCEGPGSYGRAHGLAHRTDVTARKLERQRGVQREILRAARSERLCAGEQLAMLLQDRLRQLAQLIVCPCGAARDLGRARAASGLPVVEQGRVVEQPAELQQPPCHSDGVLQPGHRGRQYCSTRRAGGERKSESPTSSYRRLMHVVDSLDELRLPRNLRELHLTRHRISRIDLPADTLASLQKARHAFCASRARATSNHARTRHSSTCGRTASRE